MMMIHMCALCGDGPIQSNPIQGAVCAVHQTSITTMPYHTITIQYNTIQYLKFPPPNSSNSLIVLFIFYCSWHGEDSLSPTKEKDICQSVRRSFCSHLSVPSSQSPSLYYPDQSYHSYIYTIHIPLPFIQQIPT